MWKMFSFDSGLHCANDGGLLRFHSMQLFSVYKPSVTNNKALKKAAMSTMKSQNEDWNGGREEKKVSVSLRIFEYFTLYPMLK